MSAMSRHATRRLLARHAREQADLLSKCQEESDTRWYREVVAAQGRLKAALDAELKASLQTDEATVCMLRGMVVEVRRALDDDDTVTALGRFASLRILLRDLRDEAHADPAKQMCEYATGLLYDAMGWTSPEVYLTAAALDVLDRIVSLVVSPTEEQYSQLRRSLCEAGFEVAPTLLDARSGC